MLFNNNWTLNLTQNTQTLSSWNFFVGRPWRLGLSLGNQNISPPLIHDFGRWAFRDEETAYFQMEFQHVSAGIFLGFCSQDEKRQRRRNTSWKKHLMKVLLHPPKNIIQPSILCNSLLFLWKKPLENPFGFEHPSKTTPGTGALGLSRGVTFVVDESSKGNHSEFVPVIFSVVGDFSLCLGDKIRCFWLRNSQDLNQRS